MGSREAVPGITCYRDGAWRDDLCTVCDTNRVTHRCRGVSNEQRVCGERAKGLRLGATQGMSQAVERVVTCSHLIKLL